MDQRAMNLAGDRDHDPAGRLLRERDFHNERFTEETRTAQAKYYWAVDHAYERYVSLVHEYSHSADIFELGCAKGENVFSNPADYKSASGIDISNVAIEEGNVTARALGKRNVEFICGDAEHIPLADQSLDFIYGSGIIHHLDVMSSATEIWRLLRPGGRALFWEPLGHNPLIDLYRRMTPNARTPDEHPLLSGDVTSLSRLFGGVELEFFGLTTLATVPFRRASFSKPLKKLAIEIDDNLFKLPHIGWLAWFVLISLKKERLQAA